MTTATTNPNGAELHAALARAQAKVENAKKTSANPHFKSKYADLATVWDVIREPFTSEGLSVLQLPVSTAAGSIGLRTVVLHSSGQGLEETFYCGVKDPTNPQQVGSALTYMKRYALMGVAGIGSEDDDGETSIGRAPPPEAKIDYSKTIADTLEALKGLSNEEARQLYARVSNSGMQQPAKNELLLQMAGIIQARMKVEAAEAANTKNTGKKK